MINLTGTLEQLVAKLKSLGVQGEWAEIAHGHQFTCTDGAKLNWFPKTGRLQYQGIKEAADKLKSVLSAESVSSPEEDTTVSAISPTPSTSLPVEKPIIDEVAAAAP